jgi:branched-chain amino acid aminotransferase
MSEPEFIWMNGEIKKWDEGKAHFLSNALHYGSAVFEGIRCYTTEQGAGVFRLDEHIERLFYSAEFFGIKVPYSKEKIKEAIFELIKKNKLSECYIRPLVFCGEGFMGFDSAKMNVEMGIAAWNWEPIMGKESSINGVSLKISPYSRPSSKCMPVNAKVSGNYSNSILAKSEAVKSGFNDAIMLDENGFVSECSAENFFMIKNNILFTPTTENCLKGITRNSVMEIAGELGYSVVEKQITPQEILESDECFASGTAAEIVPITEINRKKIGTGTRGEITKKLQEEYFNAVHGKHKKSKEWIDYVK